MGGSLGGCEPLFKDGQETPAQPAEKAVSSGFPVTIGALSCKVGLRAPLAERLMGAKRPS